jgi:uncharacterized protein
VNRTSPVNYSGTTVLITGASSGLGAEFAAQLAARGANLVLVARREDRLQELASRLEQQHGITTTVIAVDLSLPGAAASLADSLTTRGIRVDSLINNAGFGLAGTFADADPGRLAQLIAVNIATLTDLTRLLLPPLLQSGRGVLVNIASTAAYQPTPGMAAYGASKVFVLSLTESLAYETRHSGLRVLALSPGPTRTEFFDVIGTEKAAVGRFQTPVQVVSRALAELDRSHPRPSVVSGRGNALTATLARLAPRRVTLAAAARALK